MQLPGGSHVIGRVFEVGDLLAANRIYGESGIASLGKLVGAAIAVVLMAHYGINPVYEHRTIIYVWLAIGIVPVVMQRMTPAVMTRTPGI